MKHVSRSIPSLLIQGQLVSGLFSYRLRLCPALDEGGNYFSLCLIRSFYCCETDNEVDDRLPYRETLLSRSLVLVRIRTSIKRSQLRVC